MANYQSTLTRSDEVEKYFLFRLLNSDGGQGCLVVVRQGLVQDPPLNADRKLELSLNLNKTEQNLIGVY